MDRIGQLLKEIKESMHAWEREKGRIRFTGFCEEVGGVFEEKGYGTTLCFLLDKEEKQATRSQAEFIRKVVLEKFKKYPEVEQDRTKGRYIIKVLNVLRRLEV